MKIRVDKSILYILILFLFSQELFSLWPATIPVEGVDIAFIMELSYFLFSARRKKWRLNFLHENSYFVHVLFFTFIVWITSTFQAHRLYGQPIMMTLIAQRKWIGGLFSYFIYKDVFDKKSFDNRKFTKILIILAVVCCILYIAQHVLIERATFLSITTGMRRGSSNTRLYIQDLYIIFVYFIVLQQVLKSRKLKIFKILYLIMVVYILYQVAEFRLSLAGLFLATGIIILFQRYGISKKSMLIIGGMIAVYFVFNSTYAQEAIDSLLNGTSTMRVRYLGRSLYIERLMNNPILGGGYALNDWENTRRFTGYYNKIYFSDNGIFALAFLFGSIGIIWLIWLWITNFKMAIMSYRKCNIVFGLAFMCYISSTLMNEAHWFWSNGCYIFALYMAYIESDIKRNVYNSRKIRIMSITETP